MQTTQYAAEILNELHRTLERLSADEVESFADRILAANKIFVAGAGRSGLMNRSFAMRLSHMGFDAFVVGETTTPGYDEHDLLIIASGSGETKGLVSMAEKAKKIGGAVALVTIVPDSTIGRLSDITVQVPAKVKHEEDGGETSIQPMGSLFEQSILVLFDAVILRLMEKKDMGGGTMFGRHANLE